VTTSALPPKPHMSLRTKITLVCTFASILISAIATGYYYLDIRRTVLKEYQQKLSDIVGYAALVLDSDEHAELSNSNSYFGPLWTRLNSLNDSLVSIDPDIVSIYTLKKDAQGQIYYVLDSGRNYRDPSEPYVPKKAGMILTNPSHLLSSRFDSLAAPIVEQDIFLSIDANGTDSSILSAYAPFYRTDGSREGVVGVDISAGPIEAAFRRSLLISIIIVLISIPLGALAGFGIGSMILKPIHNIVEGTEIITSGNLNHQIILPSNDEMEELASKINLMTSQQGNLIAYLEHNLLEQTLELEKAAGRNERRARQLETLSQVSHQLTSLENLETMLKNTVELISEKFKLYHTGIFLNDENREHVILRSTNSEGGQKMISRAYQVKIGEEDIVGYVAASGQSRIALDTDVDSAFDKKPELPETKSEMALPLKVGNQIIGVLDVQSKVPNAFSIDDLDLYTTLADQVAIAIENMRLFETAQKTLAEAELAYRDYLKKEWTEYTKEKKPVGYSHSPKGTRKLNAPLNIKPQASEDGRIRHLHIPIKIRAQTIGQISVVAPAGKDLTQDQVNLVQAVADRLSLSSENARLFEETTRRAERERTVSEISTRLRGITDPKKMVQKAIEELQRILGAKDVKIRPYATLSSTTPIPEDAETLAKSTAKNNNKNEK
jgi:GAF domain-containing protein/HAMP domain-containing protein